MYGIITLYGRTFQIVPVHCYLNVAVLQPRHCRNNTGLGFSLSLAATQEIDVSFFSSSYLDVSVQRGIYRYQQYMITLKGYNTDVWGAEIYQKDNRYSPSMSMTCSVD